MKAVPRKKACLLLNHIYEETHPQVPATPKVEDLPSSQESDSHSQCPEESILTAGDTGAEDLPTSQDEETLHSRLVQFVKQRESLLQSILLYEPVQLSQLQAELKEAGIKCSKDQLMVITSSPSDLYFRQNMTSGLAGHRVHHLPGHRQQGEKEEEGCRILNFSSLSLVRHLGCDIEK